MNPEISEQGKILYNIYYQGNCGRGESSLDQIYLSHEKRFSVKELSEFEGRSDIDYQIKEAGIESIAEAITEEINLERLNDLAEGKTPDLHEFGEWLVKHRGFSKVDPKKTSLHITGIVEYEFNEI